MARDTKQINAGECRTATVIEESTEQIDADGYVSRKWKNAFGEGQVVMARWEITNYGAWDSFAAGERTRDERTTVQRKARITMRESKRVTATCRIRRSSETEWWDVKTIERLRDGWIVAVATREEATR